MKSNEIIRSQLEPFFKESCIDITNHQYNQIFEYYNNILHWNEVMNLTAITDEVEFAQKHIIDSLLIHKIVPMTDFETVIDIGTGAGFPGIPLKIVFPHLQITLLDSLNKRIQFLNETIEILELDYVETIHGRAEDFGKNEVYRETFDLCVSRAVSQLNILSEYCLPFVKIDGLFVAYKSVNTDDEIQGSRNAIELLGGSIGQIKDVELLNSQVIRRFVFIKKDTSTPSKFPRKAGLAQKRPL